MMLNSTLKEVVSELNDIARLLMEIGQGYEEQRKIECVARMAQDDLCSTTEYRSITTTVEGALEVYETAERAVRGSDGEE